MALWEIHNYTAEVASIINLPDQCPELEPGNTAGRSSIPGADTRLGGGAPDIVIDMRGLHP